MQSKRDIAVALEEVAKRLRDDSSDEPLHVFERGRIRDENGNTVGKWAINPD